MESKTESKASNDVAEEAIASAFTSEKLGELMTSEGPVCKCVLIKAADGVPTEVDVDMTPKTNNCAKLLGGSPTFIGQWPDLSLVVMKLRNPSDNAIVNKYKLPHPFQTEEVKGDILIIRMNEDSSPANIPLAEFLEYAEKINNTPIENLPVIATIDEDACEEEEGDDDSESEEEELQLESDSEDDEGLSPIQEAILGQVILKFKEANDREPTGEELEGIMGALNQSGDFQKIVQRLSGIAEDENNEKVEEVEEEATVTDKTALAEETEKENVETATVNKKSDEKEETEKTNVEDKPKQGIKRTAEEAMPEQKLDAKKSKVASTN